MAALAAWLRPVVMGHAHHGKDLLLIQASHVGYDPGNQRFGEYRRYQTEGALKSTSCGKIMATLAWYQKELALAKGNIFLQLSEGRRYIIVDKDLLRGDRAQGLMLNTTIMFDANSGPDRSYSTSSRFVAADSLRQLIGDDAWVSEQRIPIGNRLLPELFYFRRNIAQDTEGHSHLELNLLSAMPWILSSEHIALTAAKVNTQVEFDRTYRSILREPSYQDKNLLFMAGIHIDISPQQNQVFPLTKFIPWAAYHQTDKGQRTLYEQAEINQLLRAQSDQNPTKIDLEAAIKIMEDAQEVVIDAS